MIENQSGIILNTYQDFQQLIHQVDNKCHVGLNVSGHNVTKHINISFGCVDHKIVMKLITVFYPIYLLVAKEAVPNKIEIETTGNIS